MSEWNRGFHTAIKQVLELLDRANFNDTRKITLRGKIKKLDRRIKMSERKKKISDL